jgi:hypothetical protein
MPGVVFRWQVTQSCAPAAEARKTAPQMMSTEEIILVFIIPPYPLFPFGFCSRAGGRFPGSLPLLRRFGFPSLSLPRFLVPTFKNNGVCLELFSFPEWIKKV